jgi:hypothetical protein
LVMTVPSGPARIAAVASQRQSIDSGGESLAGRTGVTVAELDVQRGLETVRRSIAHLRARQPHAYTGAGVDRLTVAQRARNAS